MGNAQEPESDPRFWIGGGGGAATLGDDSCNPELYFLRENSTCDDRDGGYKIYAGRKLNDYLAAEIFAARLGEASFETTRFIRGFGLAEVSLTGRHNASVGGQAMILIPMKRLDAFLKIGPHWWNREVSFRGESSDVNTAGFDLVWGLGARYRISNRVSVRAEIERFVIDDYDLNFVSAGVAWHF